MTLEDYLNNESIKQKTEGGHVWVLGKTDLDGIALVVLIDDKYMLCIGGTRLMEVDNIYDLRTFCDWLGVRLNG